MLSGTDDIDMKIEKATYDPDLPHDYLPLHRQAGECGLCGRPRKDELHELEVERASATPTLQTEKGS